MRLGGGATVYSYYCSWEENDQRSLVEEAKAIMEGGH